jgi:ATP-dependent Zn protease
MVSQKEFLADIDVALGGRVAEELIFGSDNVTSGASSDLRKATATATRMVKASTAQLYVNCRDGMTPLSYYAELGILGKDWSGVS